MWKYLCLFAGNIVSFVKEIKTGKYDLKSKKVMKVCVELVKKAEGIGKRLFKKEEKKVLLERANGYFEKGEWRNCVKTLLKVKRNYEIYDDFEIYMMFAIAYYNLGGENDLKNSLECVDFLIEVAPDYSIKNMVFLWRARISIKLLKKTKNISDFDNENIHIAKRSLVYLMKFLERSKVSKDQQEEFINMCNSFTKISMRQKLQTIKRLIEEKNYLSCIELIRDCIIISRGVEDFEKDFKDLLDCVVKSFFDEKSRLSKQNREEVVNVLTGLTKLQHNDFSKNNAPLLKYKNSFSKYQINTDNLENLKKYELGK